MQVIGVYRCLQVLGVYRCFAYRWVFTGALLTGVYRCL